MGWSAPKRGRPGWPGRVRVVAAASDRGEMARASIAGIARYATSDADVVHYLLASLAAVAPALPPDKRPGLAALAEGLRFQAAKAPPRFDAEILEPTRGLGGFSS